MVEANTSAENKKFEYDLFIILLLGGLGGQTKFYKEHLTRTGILERAVLVENELPTRESINAALVEVQNKILTEW